jgi:Ser-tRNA(Ala) deacylase AlaX
VAVVLDQTILYPQGGGQPFDTGSIEAEDGTIKFCVTDVRTKSGVVSLRSTLIL